MKDVADKMDLNTIGVEELVSLGLSRLKAIRLLEYRKIRGFFRSVNEVLKARGVGKSTLEMLEPHVYVALPELPQKPFPGMTRVEKAVIGLVCCEKQRCVACPYYEYYYESVNEERACIARNRTDAKELLWEMCGRG